MPTTTNFTDFATGHPNYFPGQYLLEDDFELQHKYLSDREKYHHRSLHVSGILEGLTVNLIKDKKAIQITSGSAINSKGELIVLKQDKEFSDFKTITNGELYLQYIKETKLQQQKDVPDSYTRWIEEPIIGFATTIPNKVVEDSLKLAKLTISGDTITIDNSIREYSGLSLPNSNSKALTLRSEGNTNPNLAVLTGSLKIDGNLTVNSTEKSSFAGSLTVSGDLTVNGTISGKIDTSKITSGVLAVDRIPNLSADKINSGVLAVDRIPNLSADKITSGVLAVDRIPNLSANKITSGLMNGNLSIKGSLTIGQGKINLDGDRQIVFTDSDTTNNLKLQLWTGYGLGINSSTLFYVADGNHSWRDSQNNERMLLTTSANGGLTVKGTGISSFAGAIQPSAGNSENKGIMFPKDPSGGGGDAAWIRYYSRNPDSTDAGSKEQLTLEIGTSNDPTDHIALMPSGGVGIGTNNPGNYKFNVQGNQYISSDLTVNGAILGKVWYSDEYTWNNGQSHVKMGQSSKCVAFLTYVQGKFAGKGEQVFTYIGSDGYWYLGGNQGSGGGDIIVKARCIGSPS
jgi:hypothetical protein